MSIGQQPYRAVAFVESRLAVTTEYSALEALELDRRLAALGWRDEHGDGWWGTEIAGDGCEA